MARAFCDESDWWRIRKLLVETFGAVRPGFNWEIRRWDGWRFDRKSPPGESVLAKAIGLWEGPDGRLLGAVHPEGSGEAWLEVRPEARWLEPGMIAWAEANLSVEDGGQARHLDCWVADDDEPRRSLLAGRGYEMQEFGGWLRWLRFDGPATPAPPIAEPYSLRATRPTEDDYAGLAEVLNLAFGRTIHTAREYRTFAENSPSFDHELNLVAVTPDGKIAAHAGITYDAANRYGIVEPVCTHPDHRRHGLAAALILEGLQRLLDRGAVVASVETGDGAAANALYDGCGFTEAYHSHCWRRQF
jgi:GNAT superfamily N-acetyltransferase